jgi:LTXXQ motif family protein
MKSAIRIVLVAAGLATVPAAAAFLGSASFPSSRTSPVRLTPVPLADPFNMSFRDKSQARVVAVADDDGRNLTSALVELAQAFGPPWGRPGADMEEDFRPPFARPGGARRPGLPGLPGPSGFAHPPGLPPPPRIACEEDIDRLMALTGYLKSKMRLQGDQKIAWQKVEQKAEPSIEKMRDLCGRLPSQPAEPPGLLERIDFAEKQMTARVELLRAIAEPLQALYESLTPDQRALLAIARPMPPTPRDDRL